VSEEPTTSEERCLITGASGFIGGHLATRLHEQGRPLRCLVRPASDTTQLERPGIELVIGDLTDAASLAYAVEGCSHVVHCAALVSDWACVEEISRVNVDGTRNLLGACCAASVTRFIHISSTDVYGHPGTPAVEEHFRAGGFGNWYSQTKLEAEAEARRFQARHALDVAILRPATVYGPGSVELIGEIAHALRARHMLLIGGGRATAGLCFVENLIDAIVLALGHPAAPGQTFNISDGLAVTWRELTDALADGLGCPRARWSMPYPIAIAVGFALEHGYRALRRQTGITTTPLLSRQAVQVLGRNQDFSNRKASETLGWSPRVSYPDGMQATLAWLRSMI
jgi:nucleoside-diphosphate-sugar epimerase